MRTAPRTPKAGSILVASTVAEAIELALALAVGAGAIVRVTLIMVGKTVTRGRIWVPELAMEVLVNEDVSLIIVTFAEIVDVGAAVWDCAETDSIREANRMGITPPEQTRASQGRRGGGMVVDEGKEERPRKVGGFHPTCVKLQRNKYLAANVRGGEGASKVYMRLPTRVDVL
jgi:hypothetical protein